MPQSSNHQQSRSTSSTALNKKRLSGGSRPVLLKKNTSLKSVTKKRDAVESSAKREMFPQFCPSCEKQIVVPDEYVLYCSERCRQNDIGTSSPSWPLQMRFRSQPQPQHTFIPPVSPTARRESESLHQRVQSHASLGSAASRSTLSISSSVANSPSTTNIEYKAFEQAKNEEASRTSHRKPHSRPVSGAPSLSFSSSSLDSYYPFTPSTKQSQSLGRGQQTPVKSIELVTPTAARPVPPPPASAPLEDKLVGKLSFLNDDEDSDGEGVWMHNKRASSSNLGSAASSLQQILKRGKATPLKDK